jgi:WD40 repeat protein
LYDELLIGGSDGVPRLYKMHRETKRVIGDDANKIREFDPMPGRIFSARFNRDGSMFVAGSSLDGTGEARVYRVSAAKPDDPLLTICALPIGQDRSLLPFVVPDARTLGGGFIKLEGQKGAVYAVAFRPDGSQVASAGFDGMVRLHDPYTGKLVKELVPVPVNGVLQSNAAGQ